MGKKKDDETKALVSSEGLGMGGLGEFTEDSLLQVTQPSNEATKGSATGEEIRDAMGNVRPQMENVRVKGHGANLFQFEDGAGVAGKDGLVGVIVAFTRHNSWFDTEFGETEKGEMPPCFSNDGTTVATNAEKPQATSCTSCPRNRDAKSRDARDQAFQAAKDSRLEVCSNYISLAVSLPGREVPVRIRFTQSAFKPWARYVQSLGDVQGRFLPHEVATRLFLDNVSEKGFESSVVRFKFEGALPEAMREDFRKQRANYKALLQRTAEADDQEAPASTEAADAMAAARTEADAAKGAGAEPAL